MLRYAITDRARFKGDEPARQTALLVQGARLTADGIDYIQLREKDLSAAALASLARKLLATFQAHGSDPTRPKLLINSRADIAVATGADGVHLTASPGQLTPTQVRALYDAAGLPHPIVSVSCHTLADVVLARDSAASLILFGPVFEKVVVEELIGERRLSEGTGLDLLRAARQAAAPIPVLALGGITAENAAACIAAGAAGVAAIRLFL